MITRYLTNIVMGAALTCAAVIVTAGVAVFAQSDDEADSPSSARGECTCPQHGPQHGPRDFGPRDFGPRGSEFGPRDLGPRGGGFGYGPPPHPGMEGPGGMRGYGPPPPPHHMGGSPRDFALRGEGPGYGPPTRRPGERGPGGRADFGPRDFERPEGPPPRLEFDDLDANGDGMISREEFERAPRPDRARRGEGLPRGAERGWDRPGEGRARPGSDRSARPPRFEDHDADGDGKLSRDEAAEIPPVRHHGFDTFDEDEDGYLTREELPAPPHAHGTHRQPGPQGRF